MHDDAELRDLVRQDRYAMEKYLRRCKKRRAWPSWGLPSEASLMLLSPTIYMQSPHKNSETLAARAATRAERAEDEEDLERQLESRRMERGRKLLEKMGWRQGEGIGKRGEGTGWF